MKYNPNLLNLTSEELTNIQEKIIKYYLNQEITSKLIRSPFRNDKNPTCGFYYNSKGILKLHDFATNEFYSAIDIVKKLYNISYYKAIDKITGDYDNIINEDISVVNLSKINKEEIIWYPADPSWLNYFNRYKVITPKILLSYKVFSAKSVETLDYTLAKGSKTNPLFVYLVDDKIKWYKPLTKDKAKKWGGTTNYQTFFGLSQLPKTGKLLFITSSLKDVMVLRGLGFNAIALNGEGYGIGDDKFQTESSKELKRKLNSLEKRFKYIIFYMNNDYPGTQANIKLSTKYNKPYIQNPLKTPKDISDFIHKYSVRKTYRMLKKQICHVVSEKAFNSGGDVFPF